MNLDLVLKILLIFFFGIIASKRSHAGGVMPPSPSIARAYTIGIVGKSDSCLNFLKQELRNNGYQILLLDAISSPWDTMLRRNLDFLLFRSRNKLQLFILADQNSEKYSPKENDFCTAAPLRTIWTNTFGHSYSYHDDTYDEILIRRLYDPNQTFWRHGLNIFERGELMEMYKNAPDSALLMFAISRAYGIENEIHLELEFLKRAVDSDSGNCEYIIALGNYYFNINKYDLAYGEYSRCLSDPVNSSISNFDIGVVFFRQKEYQAALKYFLRVNENSHLYGKANSYIFQINRIKKTRQLQIQRRSINFLIGISFALAIFISVYFMGKDSNKKSRKKNILLEKKIDRIRKKISKGKLDEVFKLLELIASEKKLSASQYNELVIYQNRWNEVKKDWNLHTISLDELQIEKNRVIHGILTSLDEILEEEE